MEDERLTVKDFERLYLADDDDVVTGFDMTHAATDEVSECALEQGNSARAFASVDA